MKKISPASIFFITFWVGFVADIVLNHISSKPYSTQIIKSLNPYFEKHSPLEAAVYAGITTAPLCLLAWKLGDTFINKILFAFILGYVVDILIDVYKVFGNSLDPYYKEAGSGFWGGIAIAGALFIARFVATFVKIQI